ncbi:MAG: 6,7-dimethyl-8-ribityllumazine synthase [Bacteroidales bacterium]|nr:6,7-dimethyl-8-ribityllumazine synthase [Bacteroidales bacterium]
MATKDLSAYDPTQVPDATGLRFGIVVSDWNHEITSLLLNGAAKTLRKHGVSESDIVVRHVPGTFEITLAAQWLAEYDDLDGVICLGCVIQGETPHFTYICQGVTQGITQLNLDYNIPFIFGVLTTLNQQQAIERAGGRLGNKGDEAAVTAIRMAALQRQMEK